MQQNRYVKFFEKAKQLWINEINGKFQVKDYSGNILKVFKTKKEALEYKEKNESNIVKN